MKLKQFEKSEMTREKILAAAEKYAEKAAEHDDIAI